jgi:hypothetical protein
MQRQAFGPGFFAALQSHIGGTRKALASAGSTGQAVQCNKITQYLG